MAVAVSFCRTVFNVRAGTKIKRNRVEMCLFVSCIWTGHVFQNTRTGRGSLNSSSSSSSSSLIFIPYIPRAGDALRAHGQTKGNARLRGNI